MTSSPSTPKHKAPAKLSDAIGVVLKNWQHPRTMIEQLLVIPVIRYLIMAIVCVGFELGTFALINNALGITYYVATPVSMAVGIILNWIWSKKYVFKGSRHKVHVEFTLVMIASLIGAGIQLIVVSFSVERLNLIPIIGKCIAIMITFAWNFWFRKRFVFHSHAPEPEIAE